MADEIGTGHFKVKLTQLDEEVAAIRAELTKRLEAASAAGEEALVERYRAQLANPQLGGGGAAEIRQSTEALREQGGQIERNAQLNLFNLEVLERQARAQAALTAERQAALAGQLEMLPVQGRPGLVTPRGYVPGAEQTARADALRIEREQAAAEAARLQVLRQQLTTYSEQHVAAQQLAETQAYVNRLAQAEGAGRAEALRIQEEQAALDAARVQQMIRATAASTAYQAGVGAAQAGVKIGSTKMGAITAAPEGAVGWTAADAALQRYNAELGRFQTYATKANLESGAMTANFTRLGIAEAQASTALRRHGALTTEFLSALVKGETTLNEFGYQLTATIGKFAGWTVAAGLTYGALGALFEFGKGAIDASTGVQQLTRTIDNLDRNAASKAIVGLSQSTNVSTKEASDAMFQFSRTFHNVADASSAARLGLAAYKLDQVNMQDSVKLQTELQTQYNLTLREQGSVYDMLSAGQREYNARMQQTIPALGISLGSVKNAGGDLNQLIQQIMYIQSTIPTQGGTRVGTAIYRSASNFLNPATPQGQRGRADLQAMGIDTRGKGWTEILDEAIRAAPGMSSQQRSRMAQDIFYRQFGGRVGESIFGPEAVTRYLGITGQPGGRPGDKPITPETARGSLNQELQRELGTTRERMHSFINEMQRMGVAIAGSGIIPIFNGLLAVLTEAGHGVRFVAEAFDGLDQPAKEILTTFLLLRGAMLFLNRTRMGQSFGPLSRVARIPGIDPTYEEQSARARLASGTSTAIKSVEKEVEASTQGALANAARQQVLMSERSVIERKIASKTGDQTKLMARSSDLNVEIEALQEKQIAIERTKTAQLDTIAALKTQQVALTTSNRNVRMSEADVIALNKKVGGTVEGGPPIAGGSAAVVGSAATTRMAAQAAETAKTRSIAFQNAEGMWGRSIAGLNVARSEIGYRFNYTAARIEETVASAVAQRSMLTGLGTKMLGLASALDPLMLAIIGLPFLMSALDKLSKTAAAADAKLTPVDQHSLSSLKQVANAATSSAVHQRFLGPSLGGLNPFQESEDSWNQRRGAAEAAQGLSKSIQDARQRTFASPVRQVGFSMDELTSEMNADVKAFRQHKITKQELMRRMAELGRSAQVTSEVLTASSTDAANKAISQLTGTIKDTLGKTLAETANTAKDFLTSLDNLTPKQLEQQVQAYSSRASVFGLQGRDLGRSATTYLFLAGRARNSTDPATLQQVSTAQQAYISAINKNVTDMVNAAQSSTTAGGEQSGLTRALTSVQSQRRQAMTWADRLKKRWGYIKGFSKAVDSALNQIESNLAQQTETILQDQIQTIEANAAYKASQITGSSPQALIARAETELAGLQEAYAKAKAEHASWKILGDLLTQINTKANDIAQQKIDNARAILEAQGQLASSQIMGTGSGADIARAQQDIANAARILAFDQKNSPNDPAKIAQDQAALNNAYKALNDARQSALKQAHQDLQALIQSQVDLQKSQTSDPLKQDREQLAGDIKLLNALSPSDFQSQSQYQAARNQALAKINTDRTKTHDDIVSADMRNLAFEHNIHKIGDQAYIDGLRKILRDKKLATETRQQILEEIYNLQHQTGNLDLNVGSIKLPSIYQIRRAIGLGKKGEVPGAQNTVVNHNAVVNVYVTGAKGAQAVGRVLDDHLNTSVRSAMRAKGVI